MDGLDSSEIAEDFKEALQDMRSSDKRQVDLLTEIASENAAHAQAISRVIEDHIATVGEPFPITNCQNSQIDTDASFTNQVRAELKFPAILVMDSIIRHVGAAYSTYLGKNLFRTFMGAYRSVDERTRREMENILQSWKQPVAGLRDPRPVLEPHVTKDIENALIKFQTIMQQHSASYQPSFPANAHNQAPPPGMPFRNSPVPMGQHPAMVPQGLPVQLQQRSGTPNAYQPPPAIRSPPPGSQHGTPVNYGLPQPSHTPQPVMGVAEVRAEADQIYQSLSVQKLLGSTDPELPCILETLDKLRNILSTQVLDPVSLGQVKFQLDALSQRSKSNFGNLLGSLGSSSTPVPPPVPQSTPMSFVPVSSPPQNLPFAPPVPGAPPPLPPAALLALLQGQRQGTFSPSPPLLKSPPPQAASGISDMSAFLNQLRAGGILSATSTPSVGAVRKPGDRYGVPLTQDSITKTKRRHFIDSLFKIYPDQCRQCGRRFLGTPEGKAKKTEHMDWHFRVNSRVAEQANGGGLNSATSSVIIHRSAYLDEIQWTDLHEVDGTNDATTDATSRNAASATARRAEERFIPAPKEIELLHKPCSICMEPFKSIWHEKTQQPVWYDAMKVGDKYYHISCYEDLQRSMTTISPAKGGRKPGSARSTPDPVLGKRKFDGVGKGLDGQRSRV
jgi:pre-mRNA cleavage complex 2 protein Pcf11